MALKRVALERCDQETITNYMNEVALLNRLRGHDRIIQLMECQVIRSGSGRPKTLQMVSLDWSLSRWARRLKGHCAPANGMRRDRFLQSIGRTERKAVEHELCGFILAAGGLRPLIYAARSLYRY